MRVGKRISLLLTACVAIAALCTEVKIAPSQSIVSRSAPPSSTTTNALNLIDYFNDGNDYGWKQLNRFWHVSKGRYVADGNYRPGAIGRGAFSVTHVADPTWRNYTLNATFDDENPIRLPSPDVHAATFYVRVQSEPPNGTFYRIELWARGAGDPRGSGQVLRNGLVQLWRFEEGVPLTYIVAENSNSVIGTNQVSIRVNGNWIRIWVNGKEVLTTRDDSALLYGGVGLGAVWESQAWFDNVQVVGLM